MRHRRTIAFAFVGLSILVSGGWLAQQRGEPAQAYRKAEVLGRIVEYLADYYVDSLDASQLYDMAIDGMLEKLGDPYTNFLEEQEFGQLSLSTTGNYGGVGLQILASDGWITVITPLADTPAERAGIIAGDRIVQVEGGSTKGWTTQKAAQVLRGEPGTNVDVTIVRAGIGDSLRFTITRAEVHVSSVEGALVVSDDIAYVRLTTVSESSAEELAHTVDSLRSGGARKLVLDLRNNPGGILEQGVALADLFLDQGDVVVETRGRARGSSRVYRAERDESWADMPVVILVNRGTASAAEILSGALQDHDRAAVLGTPTFGKGVAYLLIPLTKTEAVTVTSSRWFTPSGRSIDRQHRALQQLPGGTVAALANTPADSGDFRDSIPTGGIHPDLLVPIDTLTDGEKAFAAVLGGRVPDYRNAMTAHALRLKASQVVHDPEFEVTDDMLAALLAELRSRGVEMADSIWGGARDLIASQFGAELARYQFGRANELKRLTLQDAQVHRAVDILRQAQTPRELVEFAQQHR